MECSLFAIHGFLGKPSDFIGFQSLNIIAINPYDFGKNLSFYDFANSFNNSIKTKNNILLGYSMGGRLSLHALIENPKLWKAAIIVSANPGISSLEERRERKKNDESLLNRFLNEDFDVVMKDWESQSLFGSVGHLNKRKKMDYEKDEWIQSLRNWSLGEQEDLKEAIQNLPLPILWIAGEKDLKFKTIASEMKFSHPKSRIWIAPKAFHRVPWDIKQAFEREVNQYLKEVL